MSMQIGQLLIGAEHPPVVIAEMSGNHDGSLDKAIKIVEACATSGAQILKLQTYKPETMTLDIGEGEFFINDPTSLWHGKNLFELYRQAMTPWEWHGPIFKRARELGMEAFSSPFDASAVDFLEELEVPAYKIASFEMIDLALIERVASTGKPMIISTGMASICEIEEAICTARKAGCKDLIILKCTSTYPAEPSNSNLLSIPVLRSTFGVEVGLSDHTLGIGAAVASVSLGVRVIEKHVCLNRSDGGVDSAFSLEPSELQQLVDESRNAWHALGNAKPGATEAERSSLRFRRSLYICEDIQAGDLLNTTNLRAIRPGFGLPPRYLSNLIGRRVGRAAKKGEPMKWDLLA